MRIKNDNVVTNRSGTNQGVQSQRQVRSLKDKEFYYPCSVNKGADQLHGDREADLCRCFHIYILLVFSLGGSFLYL